MSKLMFFNTETTGVNEEDRIIQVAAIVAELDNKDYYERHYDEICSSSEPIKIEAMAVHGIRQEKLNNKPPFSETEFKKRFDQLNNPENYLIAHNIEFDKKMIEKEGYENNIKFQLIDTLQCAKHMYEIGEKLERNNLTYELPNYKLQTFRYILISEEEEKLEAKKLNIEIKAHDAIGDVLILKLFFKRLYLRIKKHFKLESSKEVLNKMVELTKKPAIVKKINFGEHKGKTLEEIESLTIPNKWGKPTGPSYIDWLYREQCKSKENNDPKFDRDLHYTLKQIIDNRNRVKTIEI
jgi:DNA polymerase III epsilon subunit-like protein